MFTPFRKRTNCLKTPKRQEEANLVPIESQGETNGILESLQGQLGRRNFPNQGPVPLNINRDIMNYRPWTQYMGH